jgi:hypothetical protein
MVIPPFAGESRARVGLVSGWEGARGRIRWPRTTGRTAVVRSDPNARSQYPGLMEGADRDRWNALRMLDGGAGGHYESWFLRANHPERRLAFWIRYTIFAPRDDPEQAEGELWGIWFDGETGRTVSVYEAHAWKDCSFSKSGLDVRVGASLLQDREANGGASSGGETLRWSLRWAGGEPPLLLLSEEMYERGFPKAKALVPAPNVVFDGTLSVNGETHAVGSWIGSQNHNWGPRHTDRYAWGQVAGFDDEPDAFLECATAQLKLGPVWTPRITVAVLRLRGTEYALNSIRRGIRARGSFGFYEWSFVTRDRDVTISGRFEGRAEDFAVLTYRNPPGGVKSCHNSKLASCRIRVERNGEAPTELVTTDRAAFEIITDGSSADG